MSSFYDSYNNKQKMAKDPTEHFDDYQLEYNLNCTGQVSKAKLYSLRFEMFDTIDFFSTCLTICLIQKLL